MTVTPFDLLYLKTPRCIRSLHGCIFYRTGVTGDWSFTLRKWGISRSFAAFALTFTLTRWPSCTNSTRIPRGYTRKPKMNFLRHGLRKHSSSIRIKVRIVFFFSRGSSPVPSRTSPSLRSLRSRPPKIQLRSLGERCKLPQWGPRRSPAENGFGALWSCQKAAGSNHFEYSEVRVLQ